MAGLKFYFRSGGMRLGPQPIWHGYAPATPMKCLAASGWFGDGGLCHRSTEDTSIIRAWGKRVLLEAAVKAASRSVCDGEIA